VSAPSLDVFVTPRGFGQTARRDWWWLQPLAVFLGLSTFFIYANWARVVDESYDPVSRLFRMFRKSGRPRTPPEPELRKESAHVGA
jgi:hypothetical protein